MYNLAWNSNVTHLARKRNAHGTQRERKWNANGTQMERCFLLATLVQERVDPFQRWQFIVYSSKLMLMNQKRTSFAGDDPWWFQFHFESVCGSTGPLEGRR